MLKKSCNFIFYLEARYAANVIFQQASRPIGGILENKKYFSCKHHFYSLKTETSVLLNEIAIGIDNTFLGSESDMFIFWVCVGRHRLATRKDEDWTATNAGELQNKYLYHWAILTDNGCIGSQDCVRAVLHKKKPAREFLVPADLPRNKAILHNRVIVENVLAVCAHLRRFPKSGGVTKKSSKFIFKLEFPSPMRVFYLTLFVHLIDVFSYLFIIVFFSIGGNNSKNNAADQRCYQKNRKRRRSQGSLVEGLKIDESHSLPSQLVNRYIQIRNNDN